MKLLDFLHKKPSETDSYSDIEKRILIELVNFYNEYGYKSKEYNDPNTGGIYEHKFLSRVGLKSEDDGSLPAVFLVAAQILEERGLVKRLVRNPDFPVKGIWPTPKGFLAYNEIMSKVNKKSNSNKRLFLKLNWVLILTAITLLITGLGVIAQIFTPEIRSWFGLR